MGGKTPAKTGARIDYLSEIRAISCIAIVVFHAYLLMAGDASSFSWVTASLAVRKALMWAVPCFVMVTGALLLNPDHTVTVRKIWTKYIPRVLGALLLWSLVGLIFDAATGVTVYKSAGEAAIGYLKIIFTGSGWAPMWYLYLIIGLYILLPVYRAAAKGLGKAEMNYLLLMYVIFLSVIPTIQTVSGQQIGFYICVSTAYPLYLFLGHALVSGKTRISGWAGAVMLIASTLIVAWMAYFAVIRQLQTPTQLLNDYGFILHVLQAAGFFALAMAWTLPGWLKRMLLVIDRRSFGIYLIHFFWLKAFRNLFGMSLAASGNPASVLILAVLAFVCSLVTVAVLRHIPGIRRVS